MTSQGIIGRMAVNVATRSGSADDGTVAAVAEMIAAGMIGATRAPIIAARRPSRARVGIIARLAAAIGIIAAASACSFPARIVRAEDDCAAGTGIVVNVAGLWCVDEPTAAEPR